LKLKTYFDFLPGNRKFNRKEHRLRAEEAFNDTFLVNGTGNETEWELQEKKS
jgi:hypothetical protein